jgi:hypothetical protein
MFELKMLSKQSLESALHKAEHYRLLNEPAQAESICRDVLRVEPDNQHAITTLVLALSDQFRNEGAHRAEEARSLAASLKDEYARCYYSGIVFERRAMRQLDRGATGAGQIAYEQLRQAMTWYEKAEALRPSGNEDALLRWNTCARVIDGNSDIRPAPAQDVPTQLE